MTVFGATGGTGTEVVRQALDAGHEVIAVVRDPSRLAVPAGPRPTRHPPETRNPWPPELHVLRADVMDPAAITPAVEAVDAVVSALGPRGMRAGREDGRGLDSPTTVCSAGIRSIIRAMDKTGVRRLVAVSANGAFVDDGDGPVTRLVAKPILQRLLRHGLADIRRMEEEVRSSATDWTLMRPPRLTNGPRRGRYQTTIDRNVGRTISRVDLAHAVLTALGTPGTVGHSLGVAY